MLGLIQPSANGQQTIAEPGQQPLQRRSGRGIIGWLRDLPGRFKGWFGPRVSQGTEQEKVLVSEQVRAGPEGIQFPWFPPYIDEITGQTQEMIFWYRKMLGSPHVHAALMSQILSVASLDLRIRPANKQSKRDQRIADFVRWNLTERLAGGVPGMIWSILSGGLVDGYSLCEKVWQPEDRGEWAGKIGLQALKAKDVGNELILKTDQFRNVSIVMGLKYNGGKEYSPARFVHFRNMPFFESPVGLSKFRAVYGSWWLLQTVRTLRGIGCTSKAFPVLVGKWAHPAQETALAAALANARNQNYLTIPADVMVDALEIAGSSDSYFQNFTETLEKEIFVGITGAVLQAQEGTKQNAAGNSQVHKDTSELFVTSLATNIVALLNDRDSGLIKDMVDLNFVADRYPLATLSAVDTQEQVQRLQILTGLQKLGVKLSADEVADEFNLAPPTTEEDTLQPQQPGGGGAPGGGGDDGGGGAPDDTGGDPFAGMDEGEFFSEDAAGHEHASDTGQFTSKGKGGKKAAKAGKSSKTKAAKAGKSSKTKVEKANKSGAHPGAVHGSTVTVKPTKKRAFEGKPVAVEKPLTKQETGRVGEAVVLAYLKHNGFADAGPMNKGVTNFPIDLIEDHRPTEVKAGLASNSKGAQQWRLTFNNESAKDKADYEALSEAGKTQWNQDKQKRIHERKESVIADLEKEYPGHEIKPRTMTVIVNPDTKTADIYEFDGFHDRLSWTGEATEAAYVGSVVYG